MLMKVTMAIIGQWSILINFRVGGALDLTFRCLWTRLKVNKFIFA